MRTLRTTLSAFAILLTISSFAQKIDVSGEVFEMAKNGKVPIAFANIIHVETGSGVSTDFDGAFTIKLPKGPQKLKISSLGYVPQELTVNVERKMEPLKFELKTDAQVMEEFEVEGRKNEEGETALIMERMESTGITQIMGSEEMAKVGASNAAQGLTKVVGLSVVGSRYVFVRGLGDRYNSAYLNGLPIASPDPDNRVIPLDIFPTSVVKNIGVEKAFTPELYGDFTGGAIDIKTKSFFEEPTLKVGIGTGINTSVLGQDFLTYDGGKRDYLGMDDGGRAIPSGITTTSTYNSASSTRSDEQFNNKLNPTTQGAPVNTNFKVMGGNYKKFGTEDEPKEGGIGFLVLASHRQSSNVEEGSYRLVNKQNDVKLDYDMTKFNKTTQTSALANAVLDINKKNSIGLNFLAVNMGSDQVQETNGDHFDYSSKLYSRRFTFRQNALTAAQLLGDHEISPKLKLTWAASNNVATAEEPDRRQLVYLYTEKTNGNEYRFNAIDRLDNHRFFSDLKETELAANGMLDYTLLEDEEAEEKILSVAAGYQMRRKHRDFDYRQFIYDLNNMSTFFSGGIDHTMPEDYINTEMHDQGAYNIEEVSNPASAYEVNLETNAYFGNVNWSPTNRWNIIAGARFEDARQDIRFRDQQQPTIKQVNVLTSTNLLPSLAVKFANTEKSAVRFTASQTVSRPGFKELAPFEWTEVFAGIKMVGNPDLQNGQNYNADLRYEIYPNHGELIAATGFFKLLQNPIERSNLATASGRLQSFRNADEAIVGGMEVEAVKSLRTIAKSDSSFLSKLSLGANFSYIYSRVTLGADDGGPTSIETNDQRPLQGASPYLANVNVTMTEYGKEDRKSTVTLAYNIFGRRLFAAGIQGIGDIYELPAGRLNLTVSTPLSEKLRLSVSGSNLLNPVYNTVQETDAEDITVNSARRGISAGFSLTYSIW